MIKFTKKKVILPCCVHSWAKGNEGRIGILAKASRIMPGSMGRKIANGECFSDMESMRIQEATMGAITAMELPDDLTYDEVNRKLKISPQQFQESKYFISYELCQCSRFKKLKK